MKKKGFKLLESYRLGFFYNQHLSTGNASPLQILQIRSISKDLWVHYISCYVTINSDTQNISLRHLDESLYIVYLALN